MHLPRNPFCHTLRPRVDFLPAWMPAFRLPQPLEASQYGTEDGKSVLATSGGAEIHNNTEAIGVCPSGNHEFSPIRPYVTVSKQAIHTAC